MTAAYDLVLSLDKLGVPIFTAPPGGDGGEFRRPAGWQSLTAEGNTARLAEFRDGDADCAVLGNPVAVVDVDVQNHGDIGAVRELLAALDVTVFAEVGTPGGGRHFYIAGHPELATVHGLVGYPGVDIQSHGTNVFLPGTRRPKYDGRGYEVLYDDLDAVSDGGDPGGAARFAGWVGEHRTSGGGEVFTPSPPWDGTTPPDARERAYLDAAVRRQVEQIAVMRPESGRNTAVYLAGLKLGNYVAGAGLDETEVIAALTGAATTCGLVEEDGAKAVKASILSGLTNGKARPRAVPEATDGLAPLPVPPTLDDDKASTSDTSSDEVVPEVQLHPLDVICAADVKLRRVRYTWHGRIPLGAVTVAPGEEGIGKTTIGVRLMTDLTRGTLPGEFHGTPRNVLILAAEDGLADVMVPRLSQAGADLTRVHIVKARVALDGTGRDVIVPRDLDVIGAEVRKHDAVLVWIDSLVTSLPEDLKSIAYKDVARALKAVGNWAETEEVSVVAPWHLNKSQGTDTAIRMMDSRAFRTSVRSVLLIVADPEAPENTVGGIVALDKANAGTLAVPALRYTIESSPYVVEEVDTDTGEVRDIATSCGVAVWRGEVVGDGRQIARDALAPRIEREDGPDAWLRQYLTGAGEIPRVDVIAAAEVAGISLSAIKRAAGKIGVHSRDATGQDSNGRPFRRTRWSLRQSVHQSVPPSPTGPTGPTGETSTDPSGLISAGQAQWVQSAQSVQKGQTGASDTVLGVRLDSAPYIGNGRPPPGSCSTCGKVLAPALIAAGHDAHPTCAEEAES